MYASGAVARLSLPRTWLKQDETGCDTSCCGYVDTLLASEVALSDYINTRLALGGVWRHGWDLPGQKA